MRRFILQDASETWSSVCSYRLYPTITSALTLRWRSAKCESNTKTLNRGQYYMSGLPDYPHSPSWLTVCWVHGGSQCLTFEFCDDRSSHYFCWSDVIGTDVSDRFRSWCPPSRHFVHSRGLGAHYLQQVPLQFPGTWQHPVPPQSGPGGSERQCGNPRAVGKPWASEPAPAASPRVLRLRGTRADAGASPEEAAGGGGGGCEEARVAGQDHPV